MGFGTIFLDLITLRRWIFHRVSCGGGARARAIYSGIVAYEAYPKLWKVALLAVTALFFAAMAYHTAFGSSDMDLRKMTIAELADYQRASRSISRNRSCARWSFERKARNFPAARLSRIAIVISSACLPFQRRMR